MLLKEFYQQNLPKTTVYVFGILILLRLALSERLPGYLLPGMPHDDGWVIKNALSILRGQWLGPYDQYTLIKGVLSPLFLAFSSYIGVPFGVLNTSLYCFASVVFVLSVRPIIKKHWLQISLFSLLLFNPIPYALHTGQRIYRVGMGQWEILLVFGCLIAIFLRSNENSKSILKWAILCGLSLGAFLQTREDAVWIYPFVTTAIMFSIVAFILKKKEPKSKIIIFLLPVLIAILLNTATAITNNIHYHYPILNDRSGGNFAKVAGDLYLITPSADEDKLFKSEAYRNRYYNIYVSTMEKAFLASPTLRSAAPKIREAIRNWEGSEDPKIGQLSTDHMLFALRDGVTAFGYYKSLPETEEFYGRVHKELQTGFEKGLIVKRGFPISPLIMPLQKGDLRIILSIMPLAIRDISTFKGVSSAALPSLGNVASIKEVGLIAGGDFYTSPSSLTVSGWAFSKEDKTNITAGLYDNKGTLIAKISFLGGDDVFKHFLSNGLRYQNAKNSRFSFNIDGYDLNSGVEMRFFNTKSNLISVIPADGSATCGEDFSFHYCIDNLRIESSTEKFYSKFVGRANKVIGVYQKFIPFLSLFGCLIYFVSTIILIRQIRKKEALKILPVWIVLTGLVSTFILFMFGMCSIEATSFNALVYWYTAPAYLLLLMFCGVSVSWGIETLIISIKRIIP